MPYDAAAPGRVPGIKPSEILTEARKRYQMCVAAHAKNRQRYKEAIDFVAGAQWDDQLKRMRESQKRPCLVMDRLTTHINQVVNDQRQSKPAIKTHPVDDKADVKTAEIYNGLIRHIEHVSNASNAYETAGFTQVAGGQGVWRVLTKYVDDSAFEQEIFIKREVDPLKYWFDPDAKEMDASDGRYAFVESVLTRDAFKAEYPGIDADASDWPSENDAEGWWSTDSVRCCEYYRAVVKDTTLYLLADGSVMDADAFKMAQQGQVFPLQVIDQRPAKKTEVQWFKLGGNSVLDSRVWPGKYIPLIRIVGNEVCVDGEIQYTGLTHRAMDAQRMYNYQTSTMVEMLSLQKSAPYIGAKGQFKGVEKRWSQANVTNPPYLEYEPVDINGSLAPPPQRQAAPQVPTGNVAAMQKAAEDLQWITGQHSASFGAASNETSGKAINARQREGDTATYHYLDNQSIGILHTGRILVDLIPKIYDTKRVLRILGEDDAAQLVTNDPSQPEPMREVQGMDGQIQKIYNLGVGRYDVAVSVGPSFGTKRQEAVEAMTQLLQGNPQLWQAVGDIYIRNQDWPGSKEMADRLSKTVPPELRSEEELQGDPKVQIQQMQGVMQQMQGAVQEREMALQEAGQTLQQMQNELQTLKAQQQAQAAETQDKTQAELIKAESEKYKSDNEVRIAELEAQTAMAQAEAQGGELDETKQMFDALSQQIQALQQQHAQPDAPQESQFIAELSRGQQMTAEVLAQVAASLQKKGPAQIEIKRGPDGLAVQMVAQQSNGVPMVFNVQRGADGSISRLTM